jgi:hypothetical protein
MANDSVIGAAAPNFLEEFEIALKRRGTYLWSRIEATRAAANA